MTRSKVSKPSLDDEEKHGPFFVKSDKTLGRINAAEAHAAEMEWLRQEKEAGTGPLNQLPDQGYLDIILKRAREYGYPVDMDSMKTILQVIDDAYLDTLWRAVNKVAEQVDIEYRNWKDPEHDQAGPSKVLLDRSRRAEAARKAAEAEKAEKDYLESLLRPKKRKAAGPSKRKTATSGADAPPKESADVDTILEPLAKKPKSEVSKRAPNPRNTPSHPTAEQHAITGKDTVTSSENSAPRSAGKGVQPERKPPSRQCKPESSHTRLQPEGPKSPGSDNRLASGKDSGTVLAAPQPVRKSQQSAPGKAKRGKGVKGKAQGKGKSKS